MLEAIFTPAVQQAVFRKLLNAQSFPGKLVSLNDLTQGASSERALLAALLDAEVSLADPWSILDEVRDWPFLEARRAEAEDADFILLDGARVSAIQPRLGSLSEPEQSATLLLRVAQLGDEAAPNVPSTHAALDLRLRGCGIQEQNTLRVYGLDAAWLRLRAEWNAAFPLGVDFILTDGVRLAALPRTTHVEPIELEVV